MAEVNVQDYGYSLKTFTKKFTLPQQVRVVSGIYDTLDEISLSREEFLTLHSLKKYETVKATTYEGYTFYLPLNITSKVAIITSRGSPQISSRRMAYDNVEALAEVFPPLVASMERHRLLDIEEGDILKPIQTWILNPNEGSLQCSILNKPLSNDVFLPLSYQAKFKTLESTHYNALFLKEVVTNYPLPVQVRFLENRVHIRKHDLNSGKPISMESLGVITLLYQSDISLVVATTMDYDTGQVQSLITLPQDLDITVTPHKGSSKRSKRKSRLFELDFCDKNFVYGSTVIEEKPLDDAEVCGYEEILPRLFPRKKPGAPSRFHRNRHFPHKAESNHCNDGRNKCCHQGNTFLLNTHDDKSTVHCQHNSSHDNGYQGSSIHIADASYHGNNIPQTEKELDDEHKLEVTNSVTITKDLTQQNLRTTRPNTQSKVDYVDMSDSINISQELTKYKASVKYDRRDKGSKPYRVKTKSVSNDNLDMKYDRELDYKDVHHLELKNVDQDHTGKRSLESKYVNFSSFVLSQTQESKVSFYDDSNKKVQNDSLEIRNGHYPSALTSSNVACAGRDYNAHHDDDDDNDVDGGDGGGGDGGDDDSSGDGGGGVGRGDYTYEHLHKFNSKTSSTVSSILCNNNTYVQHSPQGSNSTTDSENSDSVDNKGDASGDKLRRTYWEGNGIGLTGSKDLLDSQFQTQQDVLTQSAEAYSIALQRSISDDYGNFLPGNFVYQDHPHRNQEISTKITAPKLQRSISQGNGKGTNVFLESSYQNLETLPQTNPQPAAHRFSALKSIKQQRLSMTIDQDQYESAEEKRPILKERRRSDLGGYKIPIRPLSMSEQHSPRTYMRYRSLSDLFRYRADLGEENKKRETDLLRQKLKPKKEKNAADDDSENDENYDDKNDNENDDEIDDENDDEIDDENDDDEIDDENDDDEIDDENDGDEEEIFEDSRGHLLVIRGEKTTSISAEVPDDFEYIHRPPAPIPCLPPRHCNTLPASFSNTFKPKETGEGRLGMLSSFTRKSITRLKSDASDYAYVDSISLRNERADRLTKIGKFWDLRKLFEEKRRYKARGKSCDELTTDQGIGGRKLSSDVSRGVMSIPRDQLQSRDQQQNAGFDKLKLCDASIHESSLRREQLRTLDVEQISELLQQMSLHRYVESFKEAKIDGSIFADLSEEMLIELQVDKVLDRRKIRKTIEEGWLPKVK